LLFDRTLFGSLAEVLSRSRQMGSDVEIAAGVNDVLTSKNAQLAAVNDATVRIL
jgi:hypothetical protein